MKKIHVVLNKGNNSFDEIETVIRATNMINVNMRRAMIYGIISGDVEDDVTLEAVKEIEFVMGAEFDSKKSI